MSVIKTKKIICDLCGKTINTAIWWYSLKFVTIEKSEKMHMCIDCFQKVKKFVSENEVKDERK